MGLAPVYEEDVLEPLYLWTENLPSWNLFQAVATQWNDSVSGRTGLNYQSVESVMRMHRIKPRKQQRFLRDIQVMERAALKAWQENT